MEVQNFLQSGWSILDRASDVEYSRPILYVLNDQDGALSFNRIGRLMALWPKQQFARSFPANPASPANWARSEKFWEIHDLPTMETIERHREQFDLLMMVTEEWKRPAECLGEYNIFHSLCKTFRPYICGKAHGLKEAEKVAKDMKKNGTEVSLWTPEHFIGASAVTTATELIQHFPSLAPHTPT
jgi:hypothetical protein